MSLHLNIIGSEKNIESLADSLDARIEIANLRRSAFETVRVPAQDEVRESLNSVSALDELKSNVQALTQMHARFRFVMREVSDLIRRV